MVRQRQKEKAFAPPRLKRLNLTIIHCSSAPLLLHNTLAKVTNETDPCGGLVGAEEHMDMMEVWWVAYAYMSSMLHGSASTIRMLVAISGQPLMTVFLARPNQPFFIFDDFNQ